MFSGRAGVKGVIAIIVKADDLWPHELLTNWFSCWPKSISARGAHVSFWHFRPTSPMIHPAISSTSYSRRGRSRTASRALVLSKPHCPH